jgi:hypothetical protein
MHAAVLVIAACTAFEASHAAVCLLPYYSCIVLKQNVLLCRIAAGMHHAGGCMQLLALTLLLACVAGRHALQALLW